MITITFPAQLLIGKYVFIRRTKPEAGLLVGGTVVGVDAVGRVIVQTREGTVCLPMGQVTEDMHAA